MLTVFSDIIKSEIIIVEFDLSSEFDLDESITYLNHAAVGVWPRRTRDAIVAFADENYHRGAAGYPAWMQTERALREQFRLLLNAASVDDIAIVKNTSEALSFVAYGLPWRAGDNVVSIQEEFPSNRIVWESLVTRGVQSKQISLTENIASPEEAIIESLDARTRLLSVSSVQYARGFKLDLVRLGDACQERGILFCVDAIQSIGAELLDVQAIKADFVMADGHKWMLGPEGVAVFYVAGKARDSLQLSQYGWHMVEAMHDFDNRDWQVATSARRFECGSPNMLGIQALHASLSLLLELGMNKVANKVKQNTEYLHQRIQQHDRLTLLSDTRPERYAGIVSFTMPGQDMAAVHDFLMKRGVICAPRGGGIRFSPHFYNSVDDLNRAIQILEQFPGS